MVVLSVVVSVIMSILITGLAGMIVACVGGKGTAEEAMIVSWLLASVGFGVAIAYIWAKGVGLC